MSGIRSIKFLAAAALLSACTVIHPPQPDLPPSSAVIPGETITIEGHPNVYAIAQAHNVSMREIIVINNLKPPYELNPGQRLILPMSHGDGAMKAASNSWGNAPAPMAAPSDIISQAPLEPVQSAPASGSGVMPAPVTSEPVAALNQPSQPPAPVQTTVGSTVKPMGQQKPSLPLNVPSPDAKPAVGPAPTPPTEADLSDEPDFVWPVQGPVVSSFGPKGQGLSNDGVNIAAPKGAPVIAAAGGTVVYAGNEMKGFGNLVLIRHADGWVTAYAHLDRVLVAKDSVVAKGDMIGTVGKTGNVPSPQLHFEVRHQSKPLDPTSVVKTD
jgi:murein DD-endopeptidase MepM/ murein hydrolase activator NlpD